MVADLDNCVSACNKCKESVFLGWLKMLKVCKERKREKERKLKILEHNFIQLECPGVQVFFLSFSFSLLFSCLLSKTPSPYNYFMHSPNYPDQPPFKNSWNVVVKACPFSVNCICIPTVFERWQVADLDNWVSA